VRRKMNIILYETQNIIDATKEQIYLQGKTHTGKRAKPRRGQVFNCHLGVGVGSEFQKKRPCIVISNTVNNINTSIVVVAPMTHTKRDYPAFIPVKHCNDAGLLLLDGYADLSAIRAVSSYRLAGLICELTKENMKEIDIAIARHLDIMHHYNTITKVLDDKQVYIEKLIGVLTTLREIVNVETNDELINTVSILANQSDARNYEK